MSVSLRTVYPEIVFLSELLIIVVIGDINIIGDLMDKYTHIILSKIWGEYRDIQFTERKHFINQVYFSIIVIN